MFRDNVERGDESSEEEENRGRIARYRYRVAGIQRVARSAKLRFVGDAHEKEMRKRWMKSRGEFVSLSFSLSRRRGGINETTLRGCGYNEMTLITTPSSINISTP